MCVSIQARLGPRLPSRVYLLVLLLSLPVLPVVPVPPVLLLDESEGAEVAGGVLEVSGVVALDDGEDGVVLVDGEAGAGVLIGAASVDVAGVGV